MDNLKEYLETLIAQIDEIALKDDEYDEYIENLADDGNHHDTFEGGYNVGHDAGMREMAIKILANM